MLSSNLDSILRTIDILVNNYNKSDGRFYANLKDTESILKHISNTLKKNLDKGKYSKNEKEVEELINYIRERFWES